MHLERRPNQISAFTVVTSVETSLPALASQCEFACGRHLRRWGRIGFDLVSGLRA